MVELPDDAYAMIVRIDERTATLAGEVELIRAAVHGNGGDGLKSRVARHGEQIDDLEKRSGRNKKIDATGVTAFLASLGAFLYEMVNHSGGNG